MDLDIALGSNSGMDITMTPGGSTGYPDLGNQHGLSGGSPDPGHLQSTLVTGPVDITPDPVTAEPWILKWP